MNEYAVFKVHEKTPYHPSFALKVGEVVLSPLLLRNFFANYTPLLQIFLSIFFIFLCRTG